MYRITSPVVLGGSTWNAANAINPKAREQRDEIDRLMDLYLQQGGEIKEIPSGVSSNYCAVKASIAKRKKK